MPTLMIDYFKLAHRETTPPHKYLEWPAMVISVKNYGQSPAIVTSYAVEFTCEKLPECLVYENKFFLDSGTAVAQGGSLTLDRSGIRPGRSLTEAEALAVSTGDKTLTVYGCVWYNDVFGSPTKTLKFSKWGAEFRRDGGFYYWIDTDYGQDGQQAD